MSNSSANPPNTVEVHWDWQKSSYPNASDYYPTIANGWNANISSTNYTWDYAYMSFGDIGNLVSNGSSMYYPFGMFQDSCWDGDIQNCTSVCTNATKLFSNFTTADGPKMNDQVPYNLLACMYYPVMSKLLGSQNLDNSSLSELQIIADQYNIIPNASTDVIQTMVDTQVYCYTSYCYNQISDFCVNFDMISGDYQAFSAEGVIPLFPDWSSVTDPSTFTINSDIGGIGVSIAYVIEMSLILFIWVALRLPRFIKWVRRTSRARTEGLRSQPDVSPAVRRREELMNAIAHHSAKTQERVTELLTDFHQAQCWFFIPLNLTVLLGLGGSTVVFQLTSLGQLTRNMAYVAAVCQGGIVFAVATMYFVLFEAHHLEENFDEQHKDEAENSPRKAEGDKHGINDTKRMIVFWVLTFISVTLGTVAWYWSFQVRHPAKLLAAQVGSPQLNWINYCGLIAPATYNDEEYGTGDYTHRPKITKRLPIIVFCWVMIIGMFLFFFRAAFTKFLKKARFMEKPVRWIYAAPAQTWIKRVVILLLEVFVLTALGLFINDYILFMRPTLPQISKDFTMGQLLALFVWAPVFVSCFYLMWDWLAAMTRTLVFNRSGNHGTTEYIQMSTKTDMPHDKFQREDSGFH